MRGIGEIKSYNKKYEPRRSTTKSEFEQTMETCGYKLKETVKIADRNIVIYEKILILSSHNLQYLSHQCKY